MSSVLVLLVPRFGRRTGFGRGRIRPRRPISLLTCILALLLCARGGRRRLQPVDDHAAGDGAKDQCARNQAYSDYAQTAEDAPHHVITNYQRGPEADRSLVYRRSAANRSTEFMSPSFVKVARPASISAWSVVSRPCSACARPWCGTAPIRSQIASADVISVAS